MRATVHPQPASLGVNSRTFAVHVDAGLCDGCSICIYFCKPAVFVLSRELSRRGVYAATVADAPSCTGCNLCEAACPQMAVRVRRLEGDDRAAS